MNGSKIDFRKASRISGLAIAGSVLASAGCAGQTERAAEPVEPEMNTLTDEERAQGWELLFDGISLDGWMGYHGPSALEGWAARNGALERVGRGGDIATEREFADFELRLEWRVEERGNSGIFIRAQSGLEQIYHSAPEMQVLDDDAHPDGASPLTSAGANYGLHEAPRGVVRPAGSWNEVRIVVDGAAVQHWLNGVQIVAYELWSPDWEARVADSKFATWPAYGRAEVGHIGLQDHGDPVWFRNIKVRVLD